MRVAVSDLLEGASLTDLTQAMGINRPSLYAAFGSKEKLFRQAIGRYLDGPACHVREALEEPTAKTVVQHLLRGSIALVTNRKNPRGCFIVQGALACGAEGEAVRREMVRRRAAGEVALRKRFERAIEEGDLPARASAADLARYITTLTQGIAVQAASGATADELEAVAKLALAAWPK